MELGMTILSEEIHTQKESHNVFSPLLMCAVNRQMEIVYLKYHRG